MKVVQERRRRVKDNLGGEVEFILQDAGGGEWSVMRIEFCKDLDRAIVSLTFEEASRIVDFLDSALLRPGGLGNVYIRNRETGTALTVNSGEDGVKRDGFSIEFAGIDDFRVLIGREDMASIRNVLRSFVEASPQES